MIETFRSLDALPDRAARLLASAGDDYFATRTWYETVLAAGLPRGSSARFAVASGGSVLLPLVEHGDDGSLASLTTPYTCLFRPLISADLGAVAVRDAGRAFGDLFRRQSTVRVDALPDDSSLVSALLDGVAAAGFRNIVFRHFGNWHEAVEGVSFDRYVAGRDGALRETIRRKLRRAERDQSLAFRIVDTERDVVPAIAEYEAVYARSWKEPEPFPAFNPCLMRAASRDGVLRLGVLRLAGRAIAVQFWIVVEGKATILKLAHDEDYKPISPGTVVTALMIRHLLDAEHVRELDFGRGDDDYKRAWVRRRRQRIGVIIANPRRPRGLAMIARHAAGRLARAARARAA